MKSAAEAEFLTGAQVRARYSISKVTLHRWVRWQSLDFPQPIKIGQRLFFPLAEIQAWERRKAASNTKKAA